MRSIVIVIIFTLLSCAHQQDKRSTQVSGSSLIGGSYEMTNHHGETVTEKDFQGQYQLIFFGFTNCGTVCPMGLSTIGRSLHKLPPTEQKLIQPIFITVDPKRDTNNVLKKYLKSFEKRFIGLRGTQVQLDQMIKRFRGYYGKIEGEDGEYSFDHSDIIYFMGRKGEYLAHFSSSIKAEDITKRIKEIIRNNK